MKIKVRETKLKNNQVGVMLDIHENGRRTQKMLKIRYCDVPRTAQERQDKKEKLELVKQIVSMKELERNSKVNGIQRSYKLDKNFFDFCDEFIALREHCDNSHYDSAIKQLKKYVKGDYLFCYDIDESFLLGFRNHLEKNLTGMSAHNYFKNIRTIIKEACYRKYFMDNPASKLVNSKGKSKEKETLTSEELRLLAQTECKYDQVKRAFLFCCLTGLRFCDASSLKWRNIQSGFIDFTQQKTKERIRTKLHPDTQILMGEAGRGEQLIFKLPTFPHCLDILRAWVADAGIDKYITWHCSRHSFATALILRNENVVTVSRLLGHKSLKETEKYVRIAEMSKIRAVESLPSIFR